MSCISVTASVISFEPTVSMSRKDVEAVMKAYSSAPAASVRAEKANGNLSITATPAVKDSKWTITRICTLAEFISAFGNGFWLNELPWDNEDGWTN